jgi:hypothetical protein
VVACLSCLLRPLIDPFLVRNLKHFRQQLLWMFYLQLVNDYLLFRDELESQLALALHTVSCRLLLDIMPGLETTVIFQDNVGISQCIN